MVDGQSIAWVLISGYLIFLFLFLFQCVLVAQLCPTLFSLCTIAARLLCPWNFPDKNTGVYCHSLLQGIFSTQGLNPEKQGLNPLGGGQLPVLQVKITHSCVCVCVFSHSKSDSLQPRGLQPANFLCPQDSPGKTTEVGCHFLLQQIFSTFLFLNFNG